MLASAQPLDVLVRLFEEYGHSQAHAELLLVLAQELVIRAIPCDRQPAIVRLFDRMKAQHQLARLPLTLLPDIETDTVDYLPRYALLSSSWSRPEKPDAQPVVQQPTAISRTIEEVGDRIASAADQHMCEGLGDRVKWAIGGTDLQGRAAAERG